MSVNCRDKDGMTPLHHVARGISRSVTAGGSSENLDGLKRQLRLGADPNLPDNNGWTALHHAAGISRFSRCGLVADAIRLLLEAGADREKPDTEGRLPLAMIGYFDPDVVELLIAPGMRLNPSLTGETILSRIFWQTDEYASATLPIEAVDLSEALEDLSQAGDKSSRAWRRAVIQKNHKAVLELLELRPSLPGCRDEWGWTPLHWATLARSSHVIRTLLNAGACAGAVDTAGITPLHIAAVLHASGIGKLLLEKGASPDPVDINGRTPLQRLISRPCDPEYIEPLFKKLIEAGADPLRRDNQGVSAFFFAVYNHPALCRRLLAAGHRESSSVLVANLKHAASDDNAAEEFFDSIEVLDDQSERVPDSRNMEPFPFVWAYLHRPSAWWSSLPFDLIEKHISDIRINASCPDSIKQALHFAEA